MNLGNDYRKENKGVYCTKCGAKIGDNDNCCPECGEIIKGRNKQLAKLNIKIAPKVIKICMIALICVCVIAGAAFAISSKLRKNTAMNKRIETVKGIDKSYSNIKNSELPDEVSDIDEIEDDAENNISDEEKAASEAEEKRKTSKVSKDWKKIYIDFFEENDYLPEIGDGCYMKDVTGDDVPEIFCYTNDGYACYYINKSNEVKKTNQAVYPIPMFYGDKVIGYSGENHDIVYNYDESTGEFKKVFEGEYSDSVCYVSGEECSQDEYDEALDNACLKGETAYLDLDSAKGDGTIIEEVKKY